jgi:hypothetical protein
MTGDRENISSMEENETSHKVELGDNNSYAFKGMGKASIKIESSNNVHLNNVFICSWFEKEFSIYLFLERKRR